MNDFIIDIQCDDLIYGEDFLEWVAANERDEEFKDEQDHHWDKIFREINGEYLDNQSCPW